MAQSIYSDFTQLLATVDFVHRFFVNLYHRDDEQKKSLAIW